MPLRDLLTNAWNIARRCRLLWLLALIETIAAGLSYLRPSDPSNPTAALGLCLFTLPLALAPFYASYGMIYAVDRYLTGRPASLKGAWDVFWARFGSLFVAGLVWFIAVSFVSVVLFIFSAILLNAMFTITGWDRLSVPGWELAIQILTPVSILLTPILDFGYRAIYLDHQLPFLALQQGLQVFLRNIKQVIVIHLVIVVTGYLLQYAASYLFLISLAPGKVDALTGQSLLQQHLIFLDTPAAIGIKNLFWLILSPLSSTLLTLIYLNSARAAQPAPVLQPENG